jgi:ATP-dependent Zn protease
MLSEAELRATAYHEAGHAVANWAYGWEIDSVTIVEDEEYAGRVTVRNKLAGKQLDLLDGDEWEAAKQDVEEAVIAIKAGPAAQRRFNSASWDVSQDYHDNQAIITYAYGTFNDDEAGQWLQELDGKVAHFLDQHWMAIEALTQKLLEKPVISGAEVAEFLEQVTSSAAVPE